MRLLPRLYTPARFTSGFSLVELSVVIAILSIVATLGLELAANFVTRTATAVSRERVMLVDDAIARFFKIYGRLPCPALKTTAPTAITYGEEDCSGSVSIAGTTIGNGLMAGAVPFRALNLPMMFSLDGFSNKINYVVTRNLTVAGGDSGAAPVHTGRFAHQLLFLPPRTMVSRASKYELAGWKSHVIAADAKCLPILQPITVQHISCFLQALISAAPYPSAG